MSGIKYSSIELEKEKKEQQTLINEISRLTKSINGYREKINALLNAIPEGVKNAFPDDIKGVNEWQNKNIPSLSSGMKNPDLKGMLTQVKGLSEEGRRFIPLLVDIKEVRSQEKARKLKGALEILKAELLGMKDIINKWEPGKYKDIERKFEHFFPMIEGNELSNVEDEIPRVTSTLNKLKKELASLEAKDNQRRYLLDALRDVCREMGWNDKGEPVLEDSTKPSSSIIYKVDTYSAGIIKFRLTLDMVDVFSYISEKEGACYREFDNISDRLKRFGIITKFNRMESSEENPRLIHSPELDFRYEGEESENEI